MGVQIEPVSAPQAMCVVLTTGVWMIGLAVVGFLGGIGCAIFAIMAGQAFGADLRHALFGKVQSLSFGNLDALETGSIITRLTNDVIQVQELVMMMLRMMVRAPMHLVGSLASPSILILDEATSSVDTRTEQHIQEAMLNLMQGRTSFVIAHRLSTIRDADQILVIDHGRVIERGRHADLLAQEGFYWRLDHSQFRATRRAIKAPGAAHTAPFAEAR